MSRNTGDILSRRTTLKALFLSGALGTAAVERSWIKPVVESVLLPAHAQTSSSHDGRDAEDTLSDPCSVRAVCDGEGNVEVAVNGRVVGSGNLGGIRIRVVFRLNGSEEETIVTTDSDGQWNASTTFEGAPSEGTVGIRASAPDGEFDEPGRCSDTYECRDDEVEEGGCDECRWDRSSLSFDGVEVCNTGDGPSNCETRYEIWFASRGNPKNGDKIDEGTIGPLGDTGCHDFSSQLEALCEQEQYRGGGLKVRAFQHPYHGAPRSDCEDSPTNHDLWSDTWECPGSED